MDTTALGPFAQSVLDKGYVRIPTENDRALVHGTDLTIVNAARASFLKESVEMSLSDKGVIKYLIRKNEWSPFRHAFITFEVKAPLMVARQMFKYIVGSDHTMDAWNEASRRYITMEPEFYLPKDNEWRSMPENKKQGSGAVLDDLTGKSLSILMQNRQQQAIEDYNFALEKNVAVEQARGFLPAYFMYTVWRWTASVNSVCWFMQQRLEKTAQLEIQKYAQAVYELVEPHFPTTTAAFKEYNLDGNDS